MNPAPDQYSCAEQVGDASCELPAYVLSGPPGSMEESDGFDAFEVISFIRDAKWLNLVVLLGSALLG